MNKRRFLALSIALGTAPLAACSVFRSTPLTQELFKDKTDYETVTSFMMTADHKQLIVIGKAHHYIFDMPPQLEAILQSPLRPQIRASFSTFEVKSGKVSGAYELRLPESMTAEDRQAATQLGFKGEFSGAQRVRGELSGHQYDVGRFQANDQLQQFNKTYQVLIHEQLSVGGTIARLPLTPLTVAADGALFLASVPVVVIGFPIFLIALSGSTKESWR